MPLNEWFLMYQQGVSTRDPEFLPVSYIQFNARVSLRPYSAALRRFGKPVEVKCEA